MSRMRWMMIGLVLMFIGAQLYCVRSYTLSPKVAEFVRARLAELDSEVDEVLPPAGGSYLPAAYRNFANNRLQAAAVTQPQNRQFTPPAWLKWAAIFAGAVVFLQGATQPK